MILLLIVHNGERKNMSLHGFIVDSGGNHFGLEMLKSATRVNTQEVLHLTVADGLCRGPGDAHLPHSRAGEYDVAVLHGRGEQGESTLGYGWLRGYSKFGDDTLVDHQVRGDILAEKSCPAIVHGVCIPIVNDGELAPEIAIHGRAVLHSCHVQFI